MRVWFKLFGMASIGALAAACATGPEARAPEQGALRPVAMSAELKAKVDAIFAWTSPDAPGCAAAAARNGKMLVKVAYGAADLERKVAITPDTLFDIGSSHKQFVAAAVLLLVEDRKLALSDDIRRFIPELPDYGHVVTVDHLLTHTSGLRDWTALLPVSAERDTAMAAILRQRGLNFRPGDEFSYSNSGFVLAKEIVARASGMPFGEFARTRIFEPLGMTATRFSVDLRDAGPMTALAYDKGREGWTVSMRVDEERGGGGVLSTVGDLLTWNAALDAKRLGARVTEKLQEPARLNNGRVLGYGRGLFIERENGAPSVYQHGGGSAGYQAWVGRVLKPGVSIAVLCNSGDGTDQGAFARGLLEAIAPEYVDWKPEPSRVTPVDVDAAALNARAGVFVEEGTGEILRLGMSDERLRIAGGPPLVPVAVDRFRNERSQLQFWSDDEFELRFASVDAFELVSKEGAVRRFNRAEAYAPTPAELGGFAGRYASDELATAFAISVDADKLAVRLPHLPDRVPQFAPVARDTFQFGQMTVRFVRDEQGRVIALDYSNPLLRKVRMMRVA